MTPHDTEAARTAGRRAPVPAVAGGPVPLQDGEYPARSVFDFSGIPSFGPLPLVDAPAPSRPEIHRPLRRAALLGLAATLAVSLSVATWSGATSKLRTLSGPDRTEAADASLATDAGLRPSLD